MINPEPDQQGAPLWTVGVPRQTTIQDAQRGFVPGWEIPVIMADKSTFTVTVSADQFTPDAVQRVIEDHVNRVVAVRALTGPGY